MSTHFAGPIDSKGGFDFSGNKVASVAVAETNGVTNVDIFSSTGAPADLTVVGVYLVALDTTAGNITVEGSAGTVVTIAKGATAGALVGGTTLANTSVSKGGTFQVDSSSAGNARVYVHYTVD